MRENCDSCHTDYEFTRESTKAVLFIENPACNHLEATCPTCGNIERIYAMPDIFLKAVLECSLHLTLCPRADDDQVARAATTWGNAVAPAAEAVMPELMDAPHWMLRELYDDLRNWKGVLDT